VKIWLGLLLFLLPLFGESKLQILVINSYHRGFQWSDDVIKGIEKSFADKSKIETSVLYMDSKRIHSNEYFESLSQLYRLQFKGRKYDLIIAVDNFAFEFVTEHYEDMFKDELVLFTGLERFDAARLERLGLSDKVFGLLERRAIPENIQIATKLFPNLKELYIINDISKNGDDSEGFIREAIAEFSPHLEINYIRSSTREEILETFSHYNPSRAILFVRFYQDKLGRLYQNKEIAEMIGQLKTPVFVTDTLFIDKGALGGKLVPIERLGEATGDLALKILSNEVSAPYFKTFDEYLYQLSYPRLKEIDLSPMKTTEFFSRFEVINRPLDFFDRHRDLINYVFVFFPFVLVFAFMLFWNLIKRMNAEELLHEKIEFNDLLLRSVENPIFWRDSRGFLIDCNAQFTRLLGISKDRLVGRSVYDICGDLHTPVLEGLLTKVLQGESEQYDIDFKNHEGETLSFLVQASEYHDKSEKVAGVVTILFDMTKERRIKEELERQRQFQIQQSKLAEIGEIFSSIAHQWKSPLVEISTIVQELVYKSRKGSLAPAILEEYTKETMTQVTYMSDTLNDFQEFVRPSKQKCSFNVVSVSQKLLELCRHNIRYNYIDLKLDIQDSPRPFIATGYPNEFMQTLLNLINNAKDAILEAKARKRIKGGRITLSIKRLNGRLEISVSDNAGGVSLEAINHIFDIYFTTKSGGHGIGLYMAKVIIEDKMGGKINVSNTEEGACFRIELHDENTHS